MANINFDANKVDPIGEFIPIPVGKYNAIVSASSKKKTTAKPDKPSVEYYAFELTIIDGQYKGRKIFDNMHVDNASDKAREIAKRQLSGLCHAVGVLVPKVTEELHNIPFIVKIGINPANDNYDASNNVKAYISCNDPSEKRTTAPIVAPAHMAAPTGENNPVAEVTSAQPKKPWEKKAKATA